MLNFFEQPWTLTAAAVMVLLSVMTFRSVIPEKRRWWQWLIPLIVAAAAFGLDHIVKTDPEKIKTLIETIMTAVENEDSAAIEGVIAENYKDAFHPTKAALMAHCRETLAEPLIAKNKLRANTSPLITPPTAAITLFTTTTFDQSSRVASTYGQSLAFFKVELHFQKQADNSWRISRINPLEVNKQPLSWSQMR